MRPTSARSAATHNLCSQMQAAPRLARGLATRARAVQPATSSLGKEHESASPVLKYCGTMLSDEHPALAALRERTLAHVPRSAMLVDALSMRALTLVARAKGARRALDVGVYTGYSALAMTLALPPPPAAAAAAAGDNEGVGRTPGSVAPIVVACELDAEFGALAEAAWEGAGVRARIDLRCPAPALETLEQLLDGGEGGTFDFAFIDADKVNYPQYYERCLQLLRPGGVIALDNTLWGGAVAEPEARLQGAAKTLHETNMLIAADLRTESVLLPIGDGIHLATKL